LNPEVAVGHGSQGKQIYLPGGIPPGTMTAEKLCAFKSLQQVSASLSTSRLKTSGRDINTLFSLIIFTD